MADLLKLTAEVAQRIAALPDEPAAAPISDARWAYREAAALLGAFEAGTLAPARGSADEAALFELVTGDCERVVTPRGGRWRLVDRVRSETVVRLGTPAKLLAALALAPLNPDDPGREMAEAYLRRTAPSLAKQTTEQLHGTLQAIAWLAPAAITMPAAAEVRGQLALTGLLQPLRELVGEHFVGRVGELATLADYVEVLPAGSRRSRVTRTLRRVFNLSEKPPLVIHGPGGIGKSTLIAKFVLDHADLEPARRFPFAYLTFDRNDLVADRPLTLLGEATRQLRAQYPEVAPAAETLEEAIRVTQMSGASGDDERAPVATKRSRVAVDLTRRDERDLVGRYATLVDGVLGGRELPNLWILDTFERAQRGPRAVERLWHFLEALQESVPRLRVVFAGRAPIEDRPTDDLALTGFDGDLAVAFLREQLTGIEVTTKFLHSVAGQVGTNPLSLKLAADLLRAEGESGLRKVQTRRKVLFRLGDEEIQGILYRRVLNHLRDPDVKAIAHPGLVVRVVTPEVIAEVLAGPCGLGDVDEARARSIFDKLLVEVSLIERAGVDAVRHRGDLRRVMLPLLERADPKQVAQIHRAAVAYYRERSGLEAKTEELYHRLALGQSSRVLDKAWENIAGEALESALDELPPAGRVYLADRLGMTLDAATIAAADDQAWARPAGRLAREYLDSGHPDDALEVVRQRGEKTMPLAVASIEVEALATLGRVDEALARADQVLVRATDEAESAAFVEVAVLAARVAEDAGKFDQALRRVIDAREAADAIGDTPLHLAAGVAALRLHRRSGTGSALTVKRLRASVLDEANNLSRRDRARNPSLVRDLAAEVGDEAPDLVADAAKLVGVDVEGDAGGILDELLSREEVSLFEDYVRGHADEVGPSDSIDLSWLKGQTTAEQGKYLSDFLTSNRGDSSTWNRALSRAYKVAADRPAFDLLA